MSINFTPNEYLLLKVGMGATVLAIVASVIAFYFWKEFCYLQRLVNGSWGSLKQNKNCSTPLKPDLPLDANMFFEVEVKRLDGMCERCDIIWGVLTIASACFAIWQCSSLWLGATVGFGAAVLAYIAIGLPFESRIKRRIHLLAPYLEPKKTRNFVDKYSWQNQSFRHIVRDVIEDHNLVR